MDEEKMKTKREIEWECLVIFGWGESEKKREIEWVFCSEEDKVTVTLALQSHWIPAPPGIFFFKVIVDYDICP